MRRAKIPMRRMRIGPALRIEAGCYPERGPSAAGGGGHGGRGGWRGTVAVADTDTVAGTMKKSLSGLERRLDPGRQRRPDPRDGGDLLDRCVADALDRAEHLEQLALALR